MATNLDLDAGLQSANTTFQAMREELFTGAQLAGPYAMWTDIVPNTGRWENHFIANWPIMRQWTGARQEKVLRDYSEILTPVSYEATLPIKRLTITRDKTGAVGKAIDGFMRQNVMAHDQTVASSLDGTSGTGPTGYDAVALFSASHGQVPNTSNISSGTNLSHANFSTARATMRKLQFENTEPAQIVPTHARCGPDLEQRYKEILSADTRIVFTDMQSDESTTAVQNATQIANVWQGELVLVVDPRVTTFYWDLYDLSKPNNKPMTLIDERRPEAINKTDMTDERRFQFDEFLYGLEGEWKVGAGQWMTAHRGTGTA
jgi:phage major head subunit gpT-like protein